MKILVGITMIVFVATSCLTGIMSAYHIHPKGTCEFVTRHTHDYIGLHAHSCVLVERDTQ